MGSHRADRRDVRAANRGTSPSPHPSTAPRATAASVPGQRAAVAVAGKRKAVKASTVSSSQISGRPMLPTMAGGLALGVAAVGAVSVGMSEASANEAPATTTTGGKASALADFDTLGLGTRIDDRQRAISRDSARDAQADAAAQKVEAAVETQAKERNAALSSLARSAEKQAATIRKNQWVLPTQGYHLTARFGMAGGLWASNHTGLDFAAPTGTPIVAVANGVITETGFDGSYGNKTVERLDDGTEIWYCHQSGIDVHVGESVRGGEHIGEIGSTGNTTGPHLHLEVRPGGGDPVDPYTALVYHGLQP